MQIPVINNGQNFNGSLIFVDKFGKKAKPELQRSITDQLGCTVPELRNLISKKSFDLFVCRDSNDTVGINANKTYKGVMRRDINYYSLHKSTLDKIVQVAKSSINEYESYLQKHV